MANKEGVVLSGPNMIVLEAMRAGSGSFIRRWTVDELEPVLIYRGADGQIRPLFSEIVFAPGRTSRGRYLCDLYAAYDPAEAEDWQEWAHVLYQPAGMLQAAVEIARRYALPEIGIWIRLPYPLIYERASDVGETVRSELAKERADRLVSWAREVQQLWEHTEHELIRERLKLRGFVWGRESIPSHDVRVATAVNEQLSERGLETLWLANYRSLHILEWRKTLQFSQVALYPNYTGNTEYDRSWLHYTAQYAAIHHIGIQMIVGRGRLYGHQHVQDYMEFLEQYNGKGGSGPIVYRFPNQSIVDVYQQRRDLYDLIYRSCSRFEGGEG